jgi:excinuclease UvrABC helicase subunit UvrB
LKFEEFEQKMKKIVAVSATPNTYEIKKSCSDPFKFFNYNPLE